MPRNPSVRLSRSSSNLNAGGGKANNAEMDGWAGGGLLLGAVISWTSYASHAVLTERMVHTASSVSLPYRPFSRQFDLGALRAEAKLVEAHARRLQQPLNILHPSMVAQVTQGLVQSLVELAGETGVLSFAPSSDEVPHSLLRRLGSKAVGVLLGAAASFPFHVARSYILAQLAGEATILPLRYTGLAQTLGSIRYADSFRYAFLPYLTLALMHELIYFSYQSRENEATEWIRRHLPPFKSRNKNVNKTKRLIAAAACTMACSLVTGFVLHPFQVVASAMAIQGSGLEGSLGVPRYASGLECAQDIFVRHGPLAFWQGVAPQVYSELVPQALATTSVALIFNAFAYLRDE